jgi:DNA-binding response OmpR family regulator
MKKTVVVIERDSDILNVVEYILTQRGYKVISFQEEDEAFEKIVEIQPDGILLDIIKPSDAGIKLCLAIKEAEKTKHIPVIALSTHPKAVAVKGICADEVLSKPFDIDELVAAVNEQFVF